MAWINCYRNGVSSLLLVMAFAAPSAGLAAERIRQRPVQHYETMLTSEAISRGPCESKSGRVFVAHSLGSECIAYYVAGTSASSTQTIFLLDGDVPPADAATPGKLDDYLKERAAAAGS